MNRRSDAGFSLLELIAIMAIIIIIGAIALPSAVSARRSYVLLISSEALSQQLNRCRQEAVRVNDRMFMKVTATEIRIDTSRDGEYDSEDGPPTLLSGGAITAMTPTSGIVEFTSRGELPIGATVSFTVSHEGWKRVVSVEKRGAVIVGPESPV